MEFNGIEERLEKLIICVKKLERFKGLDLLQTKEHSDERDIIERNFEIAAECCIDIASKIISLEGYPKPVDAHGTFITLGENGVLPEKLARKIAPLAGFRNILVHEYLKIDWNEVKENLANLGDLEEFVRWVKKYLAKKL